MSAEEVGVTAQMHSSAVVRQAVHIPNLAGLDKRQKIDVLRRNMVAISAPAASVERHGESVLPPPKGLATILRGGLRRGAIHSISHLGAVLNALIASATAAGSHVAIVGIEDLGLLSVAEQGGDLARIICVPDPGDDAVEVISLLADGVDLLVVELPRVPAPARLRRLQTRLRAEDVALVAVGQTWPQSVLRIHSQVESVAGLGNGRGRIRGIQYRVEVEHSHYPAQTTLWWVGKEVGQHQDQYQGSTEAVSSSAATVVPFPASKAAG